MGEWGGGTEGDHEGDPYMIPWHCCWLALKLDEFSEINIFYFSNFIKNTILCKFKVYNTLI